MDFEKVEKSIEGSSQEVKNLLFSEEIGKFLNETASKYNLNEEVTLQMIDEVGYIILGLKERQTLKNSLAKINVPKESVASLTMDLSRKIFTELDKLNSN